MVAAASASLRLILFGTPEFAVPTLRAMLRSRHDVVGVITQPDRPRGRGQQIVGSPVKLLAEAHSLPILQPDRLKDEAFIQAYQAWRPDLGVVAAYGKILPAVVLSTPPLGLVNVHASLLPRFRGAAPIHRAVIAGDHETGVSIMGVVQALDAGPVFATVTRPIGPDDTSVDVERDLAELGATLLIDVVDAIATGTAVFAPQAETGATYAQRLEKQEGQLDWSLPARDIHNLVRGLQPWPMVSSILNGKRIILVSSRVASEDPQGHAPPGTVVDVSGSGLRVQTGRGLLDIVMLQPEGRRPMSARDFIAGHRIAPGAAFSAVGSVSAR
jgi:methionyl-tRNA formyltransferase